MGVEKCTGIEWLEGCLPLFPTVGTIIIIIIIIINNNNNNNRQPAFLSYGTGTQRMSATTTTLVVDQGFELVS